LENGGNFALLQKMANISHFGGEWQTLCILAKNEIYPVYNEEEQFLLFGGECEHSVLWQRVEGTLAKNGRTFVL
jgi:hypothetical protein